jgi:hypothetical protein
LRAGNDRLVPTPHEVPAGSRPTPRTAELLDPDQRRSPGDGAKCNLDIGAQQLKAPRMEPQHKFDLGYVALGFSRVMVVQVGTARRRVAAPENGGECFGTKRATPRPFGAPRHAMHRPTEDRFPATFSDVMDRLAVPLAGLAPGGSVFGEIATGAQDDLAKITGNARDDVPYMTHSRQAGR